MIDSIWIRLNSTYNKGDDICSLLAEYARENSRDNYINILVNIYEAEIQKIKQDINASQLTEQQKTSINREMQHYLNTLVTRTFVVVLFWIHQST